MKSYSNDFSNEIKKMKFLIITHVAHIKNNDQYFGYAPYIREMNIWLKYADRVAIAGPLQKGIPTAIDLGYTHKSINFVKVPDFSFTSLKNSITSFFKLPIIFWRIFWAMKSTDHIHLRCPGNMGLMGCFAQMFFPNKTKSAKYAGNWDPKSKQPLTYKLQKWILSNAFLTKNMQVLVYGDWKKQSKNIKPFFTATYSNLEKDNIQKESIDSLLQFVFVGSLVSGKNPMYAVNLVDQLVKRGNKAVLNLYGEGIERAALENYIKKHHLENHVILHGNQDKETIKKAYQKSHFVILPSKSEGWPKAIAEGMFWGAIPLATKVSCVPFMLDYGNRGVLLEMDKERDIAQLNLIIGDQTNFVNKSKLAREWSQHYTTDVFESEIKKLLKQ